MTGLMLSLLGIGKFIRAHWPWFVAALGCLLLWLAWRDHEREVWNTGYNSGWLQQHAALEVEQQSHEITRASLRKALLAITDQNRAVATLKATSDARMAASDAALTKARVAAQKAENTAKVFDASASDSAGDRSAPCVPSKAFLDHSGDL